MIVRNFLLLVLVLSAFLAPQLTYAQNSLDTGFNEARNIGGNSGVDSDFLDEDGFAKFVTAGLRILLGLVGIVAAAVLVLGGVMYITSAGDEERAARAKRLILYAIIGLLLVSLSALIVNIIINTFQANP